MRYPAPGRRKRSTQHPMSSLMLSVNLVVSIGVLDSVTYAQSSEQVNSSIQTEDSHRIDSSGSATPNKSPSEDARSTNPDQVDFSIQRQRAEFKPSHSRRENGSDNRIDWTTMQSTYTHDSKGQRVDQYNSGEEPTVVLRNDIHRSGYRHTRSTIQAGFTSDNYHLVEQWGDPVQPYGEWRYPYRPFSVPYGQWGPQMPQVIGGGWGWMGGGPMGPASPYPGMMPGPNNALGPLQDDYYPQAPILSAPGMNSPWYGNRPWNGPMQPQGNAPPNGWNHQNGPPTHHRPPSLPHQPPGSHQGWQQNGGHGNGNHPFPGPSFFNAPPSSFPSRAGATQQIESSNTNPHTYGLQ